MQPQGHRRTSALRSFRELGFVNCEQRVPVRLAENVQVRLSQQGKVLPLRECHACTAAHHCVQRSLPRCTGTSTPAARWGASPPVAWRGRRRPRPETETHQPCRASRRRPFRVAGGYLSSCVCLRHGGGFHFQFFLMDVTIPRYRMAGGPSLRTGS